MYSNGLPGNVLHKDKNSDIEENVSVRPTFLVIALDVSTNFSQDQYLAKASCSLGSPARYCPSWSAYHIISRLLQGSSFPARLGVLLITSRLEDKARLGKVKGS
jgi:hypothetical protein